MTYPLFSTKVKVSTLTDGRYFWITVGLSKIVRVQCLYRVSEHKPTEVIVLLCKIVMLQGDICLLERLFEGVPQGDLKLSFNPNMEVTPNG